MKLLKATCLLILLGMLALAAVPEGSAWIPLSERKYVYEGAGTIVTSFNLPTGQITAVDNGAVTCRDSDGDGLVDAGDGGVCIPFSDLHPDVQGIYVHDENIPDEELAFQVCVDADGDGICTGGGEGAPSPLSSGNSMCRDFIAFSHSSDGFGNHNPLYIPRQWVEDYLWGHYGCGANGGFPGYIVITCAGVHSDRFGASPHQHEVTRGFALPVTKISDYWGGDFCGAPSAAKAYRLE